MCFTRLFLSDRLRRLLEGFLDRLLDDLFGLDFAFGPFLVVQFLGELVADHDGLAVSGFTPYFNEYPPVRGQLLLEILGGRLNRREFPFRIERIQALPDSVDPAKVLNAVRPLAKHFAIDNRSRKIVLVGQNFNDFRVENLLAEILGEIGACFKPSSMSLIVSASILIQHTSKAALMSFFSISLPHAAKTASGVERSILSGNP